MSYRVSTQVYSGPFDLLLQLVTRQKVDIGAISISEVAEQYLAEAERIVEIIDTLALQQKRNISVEIGAKALRQLEGERGAPLADNGEGLV